MTRKILFILLSVQAVTAFCQEQKKRILFLGNSYTYVNNLPKLLYDIAASNGDTLYFDSNAPGGYTLQGHSTNFTSLFKIEQGNWDFVVLQEQSQLPSFPDEQVESEVFPYGKLLDSIIKAKNTCAQTVFYMTWGRKNGDASNCAEWPPVCTYQGMDSLLNRRYTQMADSNHALLSPVGEVWKYIRTTSPNIELYQPDESHPSLEGSYLAALTFYAVLFRKSPNTINYLAGLDPKIANPLKNAVQEIVFNNLSKWHVGEFDPKANFSFTLGSGKEVSFLNQSANADSYLWHFGDGDSSQEKMPIHAYKSAGNFQAKLLVQHCGQIDSISKTIGIQSTGILGSSQLKPSANLFPNPVRDFIHFENLENTPYQYIIINSTGIEMMKGILNDLNDTISVEKLNPGMYFIALKELSGQSSLMKFIKL